MNFRTWSIVSKPLFWSSYPFLSIYLQKVHDLVNCLKTSHLIISLPLHPLQDRTWTWSIVWIPLIWTSGSYPFLFIYLQDVREPDKSFENLSSDHPIPSSSSNSRLYMNQLVNCLNTSNLNILSSSSSISRMYVNLINCLKTSHLITLSLPLHSSRESMWILSIIFKPLIDHPIHPSSSVFRLYANLVYCLNSMNTSDLIIQSLPLHPSPDHMWTWSIVWIPLIWSSYPSSANFDFHHSQL